MAEKRATRNCARIAASACASSGPLDDVPDTFAPAAFRTRTTILGTPSAGSGVLPRISHRLNPCLRGGAASPEAGGGAHSPTLAGREHSITGRRGLLPGETDGQVPFRLTKRDGVPWSGRRRPFEVGSSHPRQAWSSCGIRIVIVSALVLNSVSGANQGQPCPPVTPPPRRAVSAAHPPSPPE